MLSRDMTHFAIACGLAVIFVVAGAAAQNATTSAPSNGTSGEILGGCNPAGYCVQLAVTQVTGTADSLNFFLSTPTPGQSIIGNGTIPSSDFSVSPKQLVLNTNTSSNSDFSTQICDFNGCMPYPGGVVSFTWIPIPNTSFIVTGTTTRQSPFPGQTFKTTGYFSDQSATIIGSLEGQTFAASDQLFGDILMFRGVTVFF